MKTICVKLTPEIEEFYTRQTKSVQALIHEAAKRAKFPGEIEPVQIGPNDYLRLYIDIYSRDEDTRYCLEEHVVKYIEHRREIRRKD